MLSHILNRLQYLFGDDSASQLSTPLRSVTSSVKNFFCLCYKDEDLERKFLAYRSREIGRNFLFYTGFLYFGVIVNLITNHMVPLG
jgi:hypothetical protein